MAKVDFGPNVTSSSAVLLSNDSEYAILLHELELVRADITMTKFNMDEFFMISIGFLVFFMQAGFAFMEAGAIRSKNTTNILIKNFLDAFIGGIAYWLVGFGFTYTLGDGFIGHHAFASVGLEDSQYGKWFFGYVLAATSSTIVSGSVAERCQFAAYFTYSIFITGFIYPVAAHWIFAKDGWLKSTPFHDFGGGSVIHVTGGVAALMGAIILGPRTDRFDPASGKFRYIRGHSVPLMGLGGFILLLGFLALNGGSKGTISHPGDGVIASKSVVNTILACCSGGLGVLFAHKFGFMVPRAEACTWSFMLSLNGSLAAMVTICSGCDVIPPWAAVVNGFGAALVFLCIHRWLEKLGIDDPVDATAVHFGGGFWGLIATALFAQNGLFLSGNPMMLAWNLAGSLAVIAWAGVLSSLMFIILKLCNLLRVSVEDEMQGMDVIKHQEPAYTMESWGDHYGSSLQDLQRHRRYKGTGDAEQAGEDEDVPGKPGMRLTVTIPGTNDMDLADLAHLRRNLTSFFRRHSYVGMDDVILTPERSSRMPVENPVPDSGIHLISRRDVLDENLPSVQVANGKIVPVMGGETIQLPEMNSKLSSNTISSDGSAEII